MRKTSKILILALLGVMQLFVYQNCSNATLEPLAETKLSNFASGDAKLCIPSGYKLDRLSVNNINYRMEKKRLLVDNDGDGLSDEEEITLGLNPFKRRSTSQLLDSVCQLVSPNSRCESITVQCTGVENAMGLSDCDLKALELDRIYDHPVQGLDSDKDGISDYEEILYRLFPNIRDADDDYDRDLITNRKEIDRGSSPQFSDASIPDIFEKRMILNKDPNILDCPANSSESWTFELKQLPLVHTSALYSENGSSALNFNHEALENIVLFTLKLSSTTNGNSKMLITTARVNANNFDGNAMEQSFPTITTELFTEIGEVLK